jgi:succinoglycan biosynthesis transport protein ExoP
MLPGKPISPTLMLQMLRRRALLILVPPAITFFIALTYSARLPNLYRSDMLIAVDPQSVPDSFVRSTVTLRTDRRLEALRVRVFSRTTLEDLIKRFDLYPVERQSGSMESVVAKMRSDLAMPMEVPRPRWGEEPQPTAFHVQFTYPDPKIATSVTQQLGALFVETNVRERGAMAGATNRFLEMQLAASREKLEAQELKLKGFRERHGKEMPTQAQANLQALTTSQMRMQGLIESIARDRDRKLMLERLYRDAFAERPNFSVAVSGAPGGQPPVPQTVAQRLAAARGALSNLELKYTPDHPDVVRARRLVAELEPQAEAEKQAASANTSDAPAAPSFPTEQQEQLRQMRAEIESLDRQVAFKESEETRVRAEVSEYQRRLEAVPGIESEFIALARDYDTQQTAYKELLTKSTAAQLAANLEDQDIGERFRIVDPAQVPVQPLPSQRITYNAGGFGIGLVIGLLLSVLLEIRDKSFRSEADVLDVVGLPVLATVPRIITVGERGRIRTWRLIWAVGGMTSAAVAGYMFWAMQLWNSLV